MRSFIVTWFVLLASVCVILARDITTLTGVTYRSVTVTRVEKTGIAISHRDGAGFLDFSILPADIRREFGYTEATYSAAQAAQKQQQELALETQRRLTAEAVARQAADQRRTAEAQAAATRAAAERAALTPATPPSDSIASRDYASRGYTSRDYTTPRYTTPSTVSSTPSRPATSGGGQCAAITKKGYRCSRNASPGSSYCYQHGG